jgi:hypothetical protein
MVVLSTLAKLFFFVKKEKWGNLKEMGILKKRGNLNKMGNVKKKQNVKLSKESFPWNFLIMNSTRN